MAAPFRPLTPYEQRVLEFMDRVEYTRCHMEAVARAVTAAEYEAAIERAVDRYEDWLTDGEATP
jgi:hypothetical protein